MPTASILKKASSWRKKYLDKATSSDNSATIRTAVVVGATSGIGQAISHRLAEQGWKVVAVGRFREGRSDEIISTLTKYSPSSPSSLSGIKHSFISCDCFSLSNVQTAVKEIVSNHANTIDALVLTQGMATTQGFTATPEGNDEKLTLHYFSRMAFTTLLLPALAKSTMPKGSVVLSVLSGGVHSPFAKYQQDFDLSKNYSIKNAADAAGYYSDLGMDALAKANPTINFVHAAPGFVNTNWGTEFNPFLRGLVRMLQPLGKSSSDCAESMLGPTVFASAYNDDVCQKAYNGNGIIIMGDKGEPSSLTKQHTHEAIDFVWSKTIEILKKAGLHVE